MNLRTFALSTVLLFTSGSVSLAQLGQTSGGILARPVMQGGVRSAAGITALPDGARVTLREKGGFVVGGSVRVPYSPPPAGRVLTAAETQAAQERASRAFRRAAELVGAVTGFGDGLAGPFLEFLNRADVRARLPEGVKVAAPPYDLEVRVRGGALTVEVSAAQLPVTRLPATQNVLPPRSTATPAVRPGSEPVVVRVFSDFQCPYCQQFEAQVMPALEAALPAGVRLEFRHFPLESIHPVARPAAEASECAAQQSRFWAFKDALFRDRSWITGNPNTAFISMAGTQGLNVEAFRSCLAERGGKAFVDAEVTAALSLGLNSTPSVYVNGYRVENPFDVSATLRLIEFARAVDGPVR